jgi:predicted DsbA family dithiol-disulfide isomerase
VQWQPFVLHPEYPPEGIPHAVLEQRYGPGVNEHRRAMFDEAGLPYAGRLEKIPNSRRSLILGELAREKGVFDALHPRLFAAYWAEGRDIGDEQVLLEEAATVDLAEEEVREAFDDQGLQERVEAYTEAAVELGAGGVPAWLIDGRVLVPGAQPHDLFERVLERLGHSPID